MPKTKTTETIWLPGGRSFVGTKKGFIKADGEGVRRPVTLQPFRMERYAVTIARFRQFVQETDYITEAERFGWSYVFHLLLEKPEDFASPPNLLWWRKVDGADWAHPEGANSSIKGRENHPVTHISWQDAAQFAAWCGGRLVTEAEWEHAARGGLSDPLYPWGDDEPDDESRIFCNIWQGKFPHHNTLADDYLGTCPVDAFQANPYGFYNMAGNVWEWCADAFRSRSLAKEAKRRDRQALEQGERVLKGGSYLCHKSYCYRYRIAARSGRSPDSTSGNIGFRVAYDTQS